MTPERAVLLRYHEIALKGGNRSWFEERLAINARKLVQRAIGSPKDGFARVEAIRENGRVLLNVEPREAVREALSRVFGTVNYSPVRFVPTDRDAIVKAALEEVAAYFEKHGRPSTFRVLTRRSDKTIAGTSMEMDRWVGGHIKAANPGLTVDLDDPEFTVGIELRQDRSYLWTDKYPGPGGLPVGTNGHLLALLSGGLDSPVAAIQALKRGAAVGFIHFYGTPFVGPEVLEKIEDLARIVNRYQPDPQPVNVVPFGKIQEKIALVTNPKLRTVLYRRMMVRVASLLARKLEANALVTGESLGQVASQTIENIETIDDAATVPILRPLICHDKEEIISLAQKYGTFETAIRPAADCCTLFADRHPSLRSTVSLAAEQEAKFPLEELAQEALNGVEIRRAW